MPKPPAVCEYHGGCSNPPTVHLEITWGGSGGNSPDRMFVCDEHEADAPGTARHVFVVKRAIDGQWPGLWT